MSEKEALHERVRAIAGDMDLALDSGERESLLQAAAEIEGHNEAFTQVVSDKQGAEAELKRVRGLLSGAYDFIARWRAFLVVLELEHPNDIRFTRAFTGENPLVPAVWEKKA